MKKYTLINFMFDMILTGLTGGLWIIWIIIRFLKTH